VGLHRLGREVEVLQFPTEVYRGKMVSAMPGFELDRAVMTAASPDDAVAQIVRLRVQCAESVVRDNLGETVDFLPSASRTSTYHIACRDRNDTIWPHLFVNWVRLSPFGNWPFEKRKKFPQ